MSRPGRAGRAATRLPLAVRGPPVLWRASSSSASTARPRHATPPRGAATPRDGPRRRHGRRPGISLLLTCPESGSALCGTREPNKRAAPRCVRQGTAGHCAAGPPTSLAHLPRSLALGMPSATRTRRRPAAQWPAGRPKRQSPEPQSLNKPHGGQWRQSAREPRRRRDHHQRDCTDFPLSEEKPTACRV